jgi:hypothetical protein
VTDGYMNVALIGRRNEKAPRGIHHWGFTIDEDEKAAIYAKQKAYGLEPFDPRAENPTIVRPYVEDAAHDPDGNRFDLSTGIREMDREVVSQKAYAEKAETVPAK